MEYKVVDIAEGIIGDKIDGTKLENVLNDHARNGWMLKSLTAASLEGGAAPGGVDGLIIVFERSDQGQQVG